MAMNLDLPDLFGRATIVLGGHEGLREATHSLREVSAALLGQRPASLENVKAQVATFAERLRSHFAAEERPEYFGTLAAQSPGLERAIGRLLAEHQQMICILSSLCAFGSVENNGVWFGHELEGLLDILAAHERREHELIGEFFATADV
jgi:hypothetical protein